MKKLVLVAGIVAVLFVGGYLAYATWLSPTPAATQAANLQSAAPQATEPIEMPTIVTSAVNKDGIPQTVSSLTLTNSQIGKNALDDLAKMHGEGFDLVNGYRADYGGDPPQATLWVGQAKDAAAATALAKSMADKIGQGNAMFTDLQELNISNRTIYEVKGQNQLHFFYAINDKLVWLAIGSDNAADGLHSIWGAIK